MRVTRFIGALGPGIVTGASDDDPSGIATYAQAGAAYGYGMLWTALVTLPLMAAVQLVCAKIGMVSGMGLAGVVRQHYSRKVLYPIAIGLLIANTVNVGADIGAIAAGVNLLVPVNTSLLIVGLAVGLLVLQIAFPYRTIAMVFKWLVLSLFAYIGAALLAHPDWAAVAKGTFFPHVELTSKFFAMLVAILGTTISPYLFFWQADQEVEEEKAAGKRTLRARQNATDAEVRVATWDVNIGMLLSNVVMFFIIFATGATLHQAGKTEIATAAEAAEALRPLAGKAAETLMALGLIGAGVLTVPILTCSAAYAVAQALGWQHGLSKPLHRARPFYAVMALSMAAGLALNFVGISPVKALLWTAVVNGFLAPPLLVIIMIIANNPAVMGQRVNGPWLNTLGWAATAVMAAAAIGLVATWGGA